MGSQSVWHNWVNFTFIFTRFAIGFLLRSKHLLISWLQSPSAVIFSQSISSVTQSCLTLWNPMDCSTPGLLELTQTHVHRLGDAIQPSHPLSSPSSPAFNLLGSGSFPMSQFFASGGQSTGVSASTSVLPVNIRGWSPLGWTDWISQ